MSNRFKESSICGYYRDRECDSAKHFWTIMQTGLSVDAQKKDTKRNSDRWMKC